MSKCKVCGGTGVIHGDYGSAKCYACNKPKKVHHFVKSLEGSNTNDELKRYCKDTADDISLAVQLGNTHVAADLVKSLDTALQDLIAHEAERVKGMLK